MTYYKYPRTPHLEGSRLQAGDEDLSQVPFSHLKGKYLVIEEKVDGANTAISFDTDGTLLLQSRGHPSLPVKFQHFINRTTSYIFYI